MQYTHHDLSHFTHCKTLTAMDHCLVEGVSEAPVYSSARLKLLRRRRLEHKKQYVEYLHSSGLSVLEIAGTGVDATSIEETLAGMAGGVDVIVGAAFSHASWAGRTDILIKVEGQSNLGGWLYEPQIVSLARETSAETVLQLCLHAELLEVAQGTAPSQFYVVPPWKEFQAETFCFQDFAAYFRNVRHSFESYINDPGDIPYPYPKSHCDICRWNSVCEQQRREDDHLSLVANLTKAQATELNKHDVTTLAELAVLPLPLAFEPKRGSKRLLEKGREQARVQRQARETGQPVVERLPVTAGLGLCLLPEPDAADIFLHFEGDAFTGPQGLEYLMGYIARNPSGEWEYQAIWALNRVEEHQAFDAFMNYVMDRWQGNPNLHLYHYTAYEPSALKRLMGRYGTHEEDIDRMLRAGLFVDLSSVVRNGIRAGIESYSIKKLEPLFGYERQLPQAKSAAALARLKSELALDRPEYIAAEIKEDIQAHNQDDCRAILALRDWLEALRMDAINAGETVERPEPNEAEASENISEWAVKVAELMRLLTKELPEDADDWSPTHSARWLLANLLDFHRRENKSSWWNYFRLAELSADDLLKEREALSGLKFAGAVESEGRSALHRYRFDPQESEVRNGDILRQQGGEKLGTATEVSMEQGYVVIKKSANCSDMHPTAVFKHGHVNTVVLAQALFRLGTHVAEHGIESNEAYQAARDLLLRYEPRGVPQPLVQEGETILDAAKRIVISMPSGILPIQGPPGAGKTYTGSRMVCALVRQGKTVGITANSHKVIRNMLDGVCKAAHEEGTNLVCLQKVSLVEPNQMSLRFTKDNRELLEGLGDDINVGGATAWFWSREEAHELVDVLIVDEAAQMSLANVLAISGAAKVVVLLGDPQQLDQPVQGTHPDGTDISALAHLLDGKETIGSHQGLFLDQTWRLHPRICQLTSDLFYAGKLNSRNHNAHQKIATRGELSGAGLWYLPVVHEGNVNSSAEEAEAIKNLVTNLLAESSTWTNHLKESATLSLNDILVITPYNAQVQEILKRLPEIRAGTVDKFQGQEAPIAIYSTATSTPADAPRGMEFLYNLNRFNVATSRAKCGCILVTSPSLMQADCKTPRQMQLANAFCRYAERSVEIDLNQSKQ
ncbi:MAG: TM0106 family RecB-like putative nuclease [Gammaproteobacteria bacterium]|nr:TM0106 family RecB-like putative nuclease [Gammaproteobacteria bacterium]